jgi:hypothetical protein
LLDAFYGETYDLSVACLACTYGVCGFGPTPYKLAPNCLQGFTKMMMCRPGLRLS